MSCFTYLTFCILITAIATGTTALLWWIRREIQRVDRRIDMHDAVTNETSVTIATMCTDIAVLRESVKNIEADGRETKKSIAEINRTLMDKLVVK